jgi:two-component system sensor histidine kinase VicK
MLIIVGMVLVMGLSLVLFTKTVLYNKLHVKLEKRGLSLTRNIARESVNPVLTENFLDLALMLREVRNEEADIEYIYVRNAHGEVVAHTFENGFPPDLQKEYSGEARSNGEYSTRDLSTERGVVHEFIMPLLKSGAATVHLGMSQASVERDINDIMAMIIGAIAALFLGGGAAAALFVSSVTKPIHLLAVAAQALERGDMHARVPIRSNDELGQLAATFNQMAATRMQFEDALLAGERKLRDITSHLAEGIYVIDLQGKITFMNPEAERLLGWTREELNEKGAHDLVHYRKADGTLLPPEACQMHNVIKSGKNYMSVDEVFVRKGGTVFPIAVVTSPIWEDGKVVSAVTAFRDISSQKELEQERSQLILAYEDALNNIKTLKGLVPICASCKKIRDDKGFWNHLEVFIQQRTNAEFSHGICPDCAKRLYPEYVKEE